MIKAQEPTMTHTDFDKSQTNVRAMTPGGVMVSEYTFAKKETMGSQNPTIKMKNGAEPGLGSTAPSVPSDPQQLNLSTIEQKID